jgi:hypothetical protein
MRNQHAKIGIIPLKSEQLACMLLVLEKKILKIFSVFLLFCDYLPLEKGNPLHLNNLKFPPPRMICAQFG